MITQIKPCKFCGATSHYPYQCLLNPKRKSFSPRHRAKIKWEKTRRLWFSLNNKEFYNCHYCGKLLAKSEVTLDHVQSRSRVPALRYSLSNLVACCWKCNGKKGSMSGDEFMAKRSAA